MLVDAHNEDIIRFGLVMYYSKESQSTYHVLSPNAITNTDLKDRKQPLPATRKQYKNNKSDMRVILKFGNLIAIYSVWKRRK